MSISVLNLIATSLAALAGSIIGAVIAYKAQLKSSRMSVFTPARISAYGKFEEAIKQSLNGINKTTAAEIYEASNAVYLLASDKTIAALSEVQNYVRQVERGLAIDLDAFRSARLRLLNCMRDDLVVYPRSRNN